MSLDTAGCLAGLGTMFISCNFLHLRFSEILPSREGEGGCCFPSHVRLYLSLLTRDSTLPMSLVPCAVGENSVHAVTFFNLMFLENFWLLLQKQAATIHEGLSHAA